MELKLRKLQATDLFTMVKILNKVGIKQIKDAIDLNEINEVRKKLAESGDNNKDNSVTTLGLNIITSVVGVIFENLPSVENDLYAFVGSVAGMKAKDVSTMDIGEFMDLVISIVTKDEFKDFFSRASKLIK